ncbi:MAG TPA: cytochrome c [Anaerolineales bacterium]|nr:cytochrome c [Anaerolineales bacterium]
MIKRVLWLTLLASMLSACSLGGDFTPPAGSEVTAEEAVPLQPTLPPDINRGAQLFAENCTRCHGVTGKGDGEMSGQLPVNPPDFSTTTAIANRTPNDWFDIISNGKIESLMPPWQASLSEQERWDLVAYLYTLSMDEKALQASQANLPNPPANLSDLAAVIHLSNADIAAQLGENVLPYARTLWQNTPGALPNQPKALEIPATAGQGQITGKVTDATAGATAEGGLPVSLQLFDAAGNAQTAETITAQDGTYAFNELALAPEQAFLVSVRYQAATFNSEIINTTEQAHYTVPVQIYQTSVDTADYVLESVDTIVEDASNSLRVTQLLQVLVSGKKALAGTNGDPTLVIPLPNGARQVQLSDDALGRKTRATAAGIEVFATLPPAESAYQLLFSYLLPYEGEYEFLQLLPNIPQKVNLLTPTGNLQVSGSGWQTQGTAQLQDGSTVNHYLGANEKLISFSLNGYRKPLTRQWVLAEDGGTTAQLLLAMVILALSVVWFGLNWKSKK